MAEIEVVTSMSSYVGQFLLHFQKVTGFNKQSLTRPVLKAHLKDIAKKFYRMNIKEETLLTLFKLVKVLSDSTGISQEKLEACVTTFVEILCSITNFLFNNYVGRLVLFITAEMSTGLTSFIIFLFLVVSFVFNTFSVKCFLRLKEWILCLFNTEKVRNFFEQVFGTYGRTITMA